MTHVRYRVLDPDEFTPSEDHSHLDGDEYLAPADNARVDTLETQDIVEVIEWEYDDAPAGPVEVTHDGPPEPIVPSDCPPKVVYPNREHTDLTTSKLTELQCKRCGSPTEAPLVNGELRTPDECPGCERQGSFAHPVLEEYPALLILTLANPQWRPPTTVNMDPQAYEAL